MGVRTRFDQLKTWMQGSGSESTLLRRMFWVGLILRVAVITLGHTYKFRTTQDHFGFGWEMGRIARALATGYGYADPFVGHTGPTAWTPPLYPLIMAAAFKLFGVYSLLSGWVVLTINSVFSAATAPAVYLIARRCFGLRTGTKATAAGIALWSGWLWALYPANLQYAVHWVWEMALTSSLFTWALVVALRLGHAGDEAGEPKPFNLGWVFFGALWGLILLSNSSLLLALPPCAVWILYRCRAERLPQLLGKAALSGVVCALVLSPWIIRNELALHAFIPMRSNFGAEFYESVNPLHEGFPWGTVFALSEREPAFQRYRQLGEVAYSQEQGRRAAVIFAQDRARIARQTVLRAYMYWFGVPHAIEPGWMSPINEAIRELDFGFISLAGFLGVALAIRNHVTGAWLFFWIFLLYPLVYYAITVQARFRAPLEPLLTILIVYLFQSAELPLRWRGHRLNPAEGSAP